VYSGASECLGGEEVALCGSEFAHITESNWVENIPEDWAAVYPDDVYYFYEFWQNNKGSYTNARRLDHETPADEKAERCVLLQFSGRRAFMLQLTANLAIPHNYYVSSLFVPQVLQHGRLF